MATQAAKAGRVNHRQLAYQHLREQLLLRAFAPGARLSDFVLAKQIGISRSPIREAFGRLESEGLVEQVPHHGTFVRELDAAQLENVYELRMLLEGYAAGRAATRVSEAQLRQLQAICDRLHKMVRQQRAARVQRMSPEDAEAWIGLDVAFHMIIVRASGNDHVAKIVSDFRIMTNICSVKREPADLSFLYVQASTWRDHLRVLRALLRRDADAARHWMSRHIELAKNAAVRFAREQDEQQAPARVWPSAVRELIERLELSDD